jgi:hypothetical protein
MRTLALLSCLLMASLAQAQEFVITKASLPTPPKAPSPPKVVEKLDWGAAYERSLKTGKPLIAWVGVEAQCPD